MSDARWAEINAAVASAVKHFGWAVSAFPRLDQAEDRYMAEMAFQHAMQSGQTSLEAALLRILDLFQEQPPTGARWHADLIARVRCEVDGRPAILSDKIAAAADETRRFRSIAAHAYDTFDRTRATPAVEAAALLIASLPAEVARFRRVVDP